MSLQKTIHNRLIVATKEKDTVYVSTLRMLRAAIKNREVELQAEPDDQEILRLISTQVKQRKEAISQFKDGGRDDLVNKEERELSVLMSYLPEQHSPEAIVCPALGNHISIRDQAVVILITRMADVAAGTHG